MTETSLTWNLQTTGVSGVQSDIQKISGTASQAHREIAKTPNVSGWRNGVGQIRSSFSGLFDDVMKITAVVGVGFGVKELFGSYRAEQAQLLQIQYAAGMTRTEIKALSDEFQRQSLESGIAASELEKITQSMMDYGISVKEATALSPKIAGLARLQGTTAESVQEGYIASRGILGPGVSPEQTLAYFAELSGGAGVDEAVVSRVLARSGTTFAGRGGLQGEEGFRALGGMLTVLANTYKGKPKEIESGMNMLADSLGDEKAIKGMRSLLNLGENEALPSLDIMFTQLATAIGTGGLTKEEVFKRLPQQLAHLLLDSSRYIGSANDAMAGIVGDTNKLEGWLTEATESDPFGTMINALKTSLMPLIATFGDYLKDHMPEIISALGTFLDATLKAAEFLGFLIKEEPSENIKKEAEQQLIKQGVISKDWREGDLFEKVQAMDKINTRANILQKEEQSPINKKIYERQEEINRERLQRVQTTDQGMTQRTTDTIQLNIQTTVTPDGVTTRATATQDGRDVSGQQIATN